MTRYTKALAALLGAVGTWGVTAADDGVLVLGEYFGLLIALSTALAVFALPNRPPHGERHDPTLSEQDPAHDAGEVAWGTVAIAVLATLLFLLLLGAFGAGDAFAGSTWN